MVAWSYQTKIVCPTAPAASNVDRLFDGPLIVTGAIEYTPIPPKELTVAVHFDGDGTTWRLSGICKLNDDDPSRVVVIVVEIGTPHTVGVMDCPD